MELRHLIYFKTVAEELHFRNAAAKLFISQPPLSRQIKELEKELGAQLFTRSNKRVQLTNAGKYFKEEVEEILSRLEESKSKLRQIHQNLSGELNIGYVSSVYQPKLAHVLREMQQVFPYIKTRLYEIPTIKQIEALEKNKLHIGILRAPILSEKLHIQSLFFDPFVIVVPENQIFENTHDLTHYLKKQPFIFFNEQYAPDFHLKLMEICKRIGFQPQITHEANNVHSIIQLVKAGLGVTILPQSVQSQHASARLNFLRIPHIPIHTEIVIAYKKSTDNAAVNWFIQHYKNAHEK